MLFCQPHHYDLAKTLKSHETRAHKTRQNDRIHRKMTSEDEKPTSLNSGAPNITPDDERDAMGSPCPLMSQVQGRLIALLIPRATTSKTPTRPTRPTGKTLGAGVGSEARTPCPLARNDRTVSGGSGCSSWQDPCNHGHDHRTAALRACIALPATWLHA
jgi:hypothetical protein